MAKQASKSARTDSSVVRSAAAVSSDTDAVAAAPLVAAVEAAFAPKPIAVAEAIAANVRSVLLGQARTMYDQAVNLTAAVEAVARTARRMAITPSAGSFRGSPSCLASFATGSRPFHFSEVDGNGGGNANFDAIEARSIQPLFTSFS
jgi:hypothetical protein